MRNLIPLFALIVAAPVAAAPISADRIKADVRVLASDDFGGRGPGEPGEAKTVAFLAQAFARAGLKPGGDAGGWTQAVPLVRLDREPGATMALTFDKARRPLSLGKDATLALRNPGRTTIENAPLVFAGYGIVDPALGWDAYRGVDMAGKVAVVLANDADFEAGKDLGFEGRRMAYPGRVGAKFEAAARAGATGVLVIHEDAAASYPFFQVGSGDALPSMISAPQNPSTLLASGWLSGPAAANLLRDAGLDLQALKIRSREKAFAAFPIPGATLSVDGVLKATPFTSQNVIAILPGASRPAEYVLYGAHWDANGRNGPDAKGDPIRNGAVDNATGTAELIEVARAFAAGKRPARTTIFAAWTAEEKGLLGSEYYAANPPYPLARTAAVINLDPHVVLPAARNLELVGGGRTTLEADLGAAAAAMGLRLDDEPSPEAGWYFRSDHFPFARRGVPALSFRAGRDLADGGRARGDAIVDAYNQHDYHQTTDQFDGGWTFAGTAQEAEAAFRVGQAIANTTAWPGWTSAPEFAAARAGSNAERPPL